MWSLKPEDFLKNFNMKTEFHKVQNKDVYKQKKEHIYSK